MTRIHTRKLQQYTRKLTTIHTRRLKIQLVEKVNHYKFKLICAFVRGVMIIIIIIITAIGLSPGGSGYFTCKRNMKLATTKLKSGGLREKHVVANWSLGNHLCVCL